MRQGVFERAAGGTLFLDEIDSLPLLPQANLLRVLQEGEFERVGGKQVLHADVRIIAASNTPMDRLLARGGFRQDLYYRLNVVPIHIPSRHHNSTIGIRHGIQERLHDLKTPGRILRVNLKRMAALRFTVAVNRGSSVYAL